jgi:DNA-binding response OmpR family regulator
MGQAKNKQKSGIILVITDGGYYKSYHNFSIKNRKIEIHPFEEAVDAVKDCQVDLILLDCTVNLEEGLNILKANKTKCPAIPNIFITDISHEDLVLRVFRSGARDFFRKPVNFVELKHTVEGLLAVKTASKETRCPFISSAGSS